MQYLKYILLIFIWVQTPLCDFMPIYVFCSLSLSLSLSLSTLSFLIICNVPHAYADNIPINMDDRRNETLLIISRVRLPRESDKCIILIGKCCIWVLWSLNKNRNIIFAPKNVLFPIIIMDTTFSIRILKNYFATWIFTFLNFIIIYNLRSNSITTTYTLKYVEWRRYNWLHRTNTTFVEMQTLMHTALQK